MKTTKENNKLIAEFMGRNFVEGGSNNELTTNDISELRCTYHKSWDSLMPVIEKLRGFLLNIAGGLKGQNILHGLEDSFINNDIASANEYVVSAIEWKHEMDQPPKVLSESDVDAISSFTDIQIGFLYTSVADEFELETGDVGPAHVFEMDELKEKIVKLMTNYVLVNK